MNPGNCHSSRITVEGRGTSDFLIPETIYVYTNIETNLLGLPYVRSLPTLHFPSNTGYRRFRRGYLRYPRLNLRSKPLEQ